MSQRVFAEIQKHIDPQEQVLWSGQPRQGLVLRGSDIFLIPFSLLWGGFAFFWEYNVVTQGAPLFFALFGIPFVLVGLYLIVGRFYLEAKQREKTFYAITSERVLMVSGLLQQKVKSLALRTVSDMSLTESKNGLGTISFGSSLPFAALFGGMMWPGMDQYVGPRLDMIHQPKQVYQLIRDTQKNAV